MSKITIMMKHPDAVDDGLAYAVEIEGVSEEVADEARDKFFKYGEMVTIEIDTDTMTATVVPVS